MRLIYCTLAMALIGMPAPLMAAETPTNADIAKRLRDLDRRIERLEKIEKAETKTEKKAAERKADRKADRKAAAAAQGPSTDDWKKITYSMDQAQVQKILGEPLRTRSTARHQIWSYYPTSVAGGEIWFSNREVDRIIAPYK